MFINHWMAHLDLKILFGKIAYYLRNRNLEDTGKGLVREREFHVRFRSVIYLPLKLAFNTILSFSGKDFKVQW